MKKTPAINLATAKKIKHPNILAQLKNIKAILFLIAVEGPEHFWGASDGTLLITQNGILKRTDALPGNLHNLRYTRGFNPFKHSLATIRKTTLASGTLSLMPQKLFSLPFTSDFANIGNQTIQTANGKQVLKKIKQRVFVPSINWSYVNYFWVNQKTGKIVKSSQHFSPTQGPLTIQVVKSYQAKAQHT